MFRSFNYTRLVRGLAITTLAIFFLYGLLLTCMPLLPFWIDEWLLIDNLKFKSPAQLWHVLDHTQQFPRVYLELIKCLGAVCDYSYTALRLPSFLAHSFGLVLLYRLSGRLFRQDTLSRFLWMMIYVSFSTSIHYFVQLKQYTMEMALSVVGMWQLLELVRMESKRPSGLALFLLCISFAAGPFFSYTYPIVIAPIYVVILIRSLRAKRWNRAAGLPLLIGIGSVIVCYFLDTRQVLADKGMQDFWQELLMKTFSLRTFFVNIYKMFYNIGSGDLFGNLFGVLGVAAFLYGSFKCIRTAFSANDELDLLLRYSCLLIWLVIGLFVGGKLPLGTFRLNSFAVPAIGILIVYLLSRLKTGKGPMPVAVGISLLLFLASVGNVYATIAELAGEEHAKKLRIYHASGRAILAARRQKLPVLVTSGIAYPFDDRWPGDWILRTHPQYKVDEPLPVYALPGINDADRYIHDLHLTEGAIILDGDSVRKVSPGAPI